MQDVSQDPVSDQTISPPAVIGAGQTFASVTDKISSIALRKRTPTGWFVGAGISFLLAMVLFYTIGYLVLTGIGIWGNNIPVGWAFDIINFVWWIGIGHAGTLISAILLLLRQQWRTSINRFAEAMTLFAVACAGLFPLLHTGRPWLAHWLFPVPNNAAKVVYGILAMGWRGSARHWHRYETAYLLLAGLATPLVVSVHTVVSFDFAVSIIPGWHATIFPPYFVAGAIYSGFAMVMTLAIPLRKFYGLEDFITMRHLRNMAKIMLATGLIVGYGYMMETFTAWYSANTFEEFMIRNRMTGPYAPLYWLLIACNIVIPQLLWSRKVRWNVPLLFIISIVINIGMWLERFVIIVTSLHHDFLPSSWAMYKPTIWDFSMFLGTIGLFLSLLFLFIRFLPMISIFEIRTILPQAEVKE
jgi:molybdopterin-containing oxidoreductase family membrane subunit